MKKKWGSWRLYEDPGALLLPGEMNILQIRCKIDFNTFLLRKTYRRGMKWLRTMLLVHVGWLLGIPCHRRWFLVLTGTNWWLWMTFGVLFITLSLNNAIFCVIFCYLLLALKFFWLFWYETSLNEYLHWTRISVKGLKSIFQRRKPSNWWPNIVMAMDASHTFSRASAILVRQMEIFHMILLHPRGQLWAKLWQLCRLFDGFKWPSKSKMAKFDHKNGHNSKVIFGHKFTLRMLSQEYSSDLT